MMIGIIFCLGVAFIATLLGDQQHFIGAPIIGMIMGIILASLTNNNKAIVKGTSFVSKYFLKAGIVILGGTLNIYAVVAAGASALPLIVVNVCAAFTVAFLVGNKIGLSSNTKIMVGSGATICGGTAIATTSSILKAKEDETAYALASIFLIDLLAAILIPYVSAGLDLSPTQYSFLGGLAIADTSSVVAAGVTFDKIMGATAQVSNAITAGTLAVTVKLVRTTMLIFLAVIISFVQLRKADSEEGETKKFSWNHVGKAFPLFILGFVILAIFNTAGFFPKEMLKVFSKLSKFFITTALVAIGFKINFKTMISKGMKPLLLGSCAWLTITAITCTYIFFFIK